jgi:hypothetical protein
VLLGLSSAALVTLVVLAWRHDAIGAMADCVRTNRPGHD